MLIIRCCLCDKIIENIADEIGDLQPCDEVVFVDLRGNLASSHQECRNIAIASGEVIEEAA